MKVAVFSTEPYDRQFLDAANAEAKANHELVYFENRLQPKTASLADGFPAICVFVNDDVSGETLEILAQRGTKLIALRCTGFNNVDVAKANELGIKVVRVTVYSPTIAQMKPGVTLINTSRGKLIDTKAVIDGIKSGQVGRLGLDVYEQEDTLFYQDLSGTVIQDDNIQLLQSFPNVLITSH
jgi:lactate dehydrogenase-like 2-hydroxyacid dehydrogenase